MMELMPLFMFLFVCLGLFIGYPVAFSLGGTALLFSLLGSLAGVFDNSFLYALPARIYGIMNNQILVSVPLFVFMGLVLEKSKISESLLTSMAAAFGRSKSGIGLSVILVGMLLAASTGIVGATVVTMGLISLPVMLNRGYSPALSSGIITATGTLGQIIPPSIALVLLGDVLSSAYQKSQLDQGIFSPETISVGDLFAGAIVPGMLLVLLYGVYTFAATSLSSSKNVGEPLQEEENSESLLAGLVPPLMLIAIVLGSILLGFATPTEAAGAGGAGALILAAIKKRLSTSVLFDISLGTLKVSSMIFAILIGASIFSLVFRGFGGEEMVNSVFESLPGGMLGATILVMLVVFLLGFILDFIEITFVVVPIVAPALFSMGVDPVWLGILLAINLQTSFLTPPFGFALFYLRGVAPPSVKTTDIYKGVIPFVVIQLLLMAMLFIWPDIATWLPDTIQ